MKTAKIADAKHNLSKYLAIVRKGGRVRILDRNTPVAELVPVVASPPGDEDAEESIVRRGVGRRGTGPFPEDIFEPGELDPKGETLRFLLEERKNGR